MLFIVLPAYSGVSEYIDSYAKMFDKESYKSFSKVMKGQATVSDIEKQALIDKDVAEELNSNFIFTDLEECIRIVIAENYDIKISDAEAIQAYWLNKNADVQILPDIGYNYNISYLGGRYLVGGIVGTTTHEIPIQSVFGLVWSTYNQGKFFFNVLKTKNIYKASVYNLEFTKEEAILNTVLAYYDLLGMKKEIEVQKMNLYDRFEQLKYTEGRFQAGLGTLYDVKRAQAELAGAQQEYTQAINSLRLFQAHLANILGVDVFDAIYPFEINIDARELIDSSVDINVLYETAMETREDIKSKAAEIQAYRAIRNANVTDILPNVTFTYQNGFVGTKRVGLNQNNSVMLDITTALGKNMLLGTITQIKADTAAVKQKKLELANLKRKVKEDILNSYYDSENALKKVEASKVEVEAADLSLDLSLNNMKAGEATFIDVIASQNLKVQANINLIKNMIEYNKAQAQLLFDVGLLSYKSVLKDYKKRFY